ncbi:leucine-rich repeat domain-containing protein [Porcipelethomonas sp.]|uniref:leucine-rich repeat domain-containing protein n=1 Tax=Porcipelethomonas sp. TaxID=2981675 RepID=UPI003EF4853D
MKRIIKILSVLTASAITVLCPGISLCADETYVISADNSQYKYIDNGDGTIDIAINEYSSGVLSGNVVIPSSLDGKTVTGICKNGFSGQEKITSISIPESVTGINSLAFANCLELSSVSLPDGITSMGSMVFSSTKYEDNLLKSADTSYIVINDYILYMYYGKDTDIYIPDGIRVIAGSAFSYNGYSESDDFKIKTVTIPDSVEYIGADAFYGCDNLETLKMGTGVKEIGTNAFTCTSMTIYGYSGTYAQKYAQSHDFKFVLIIPNEDEYKYECEYSDNFKQYYFSTDKSFSKDGLKIYKRNYDGSREEITDWEFSSTPETLYKSAANK